MTISPFVPASTSGPTFIFPLRPPSSPSPIPSPLDDNLLPRQHQLIVSPPFPPFHHRPVQTHSPSLLDKQRIPFFSTKTYLISPYSIYVASPIHRQSPSTSSFVLTQPPLPTLLVDLSARQASLLSSLYSLIQSSSMQQIGQISAAEQHAVIPSCMSTPANSCHPLTDRLPLHLYPLTTDNEHEMNTQEGAPPSPNSLAFPSDVSRSPSPEPPHSPIASDIGQSPSASTFLRTAATLEGLAQQLSTISNDDDGIGGAVCCCGAGEDGRGCRMAQGRERMTEKLILSGEIGNALLQRYEALEKKHAFEVKRLGLQLEVKRTSLGDSIRRINALEKANGTHLGKYSDLNRKYEALEKVSLETTRAEAQRYTQSLHTQNLTQQSLTHVRTELTTLRNTMQRQSIALASGAGVEDRLSDAERRYEEAKELQIAAERQTKEEGRKRMRAEARISEQEQQLRVAQREIEEIKEARTKDAQVLLDNAKSRLESLHQELSETFRADSPSEQPEYLRALEGLVASNAMLKHDVSELSHLLAESKDEIRGLREENEELRATTGVAGRVSPGVPPHLAAELRQSHSRTESSPNVGTFDRSTWARMSVSSSTRWDHNRRSSFAPSFASTSTADGGLTSPGLGMGSIGEFGGQLLRERDGALSPPPASSDGRESPQLGGAFRTSPSGGIGYILNGVPKVGAVKPQYRRRASDRPRMPSRSYTSQGVGSIAESAPLESDVGHTTDEPLSPSSEYFRAADISRKRRSLMLQRHHSASPHESADFSDTASRTLVDPSTADGVSAYSEGEIGSAHPPKPSPAKAAHRRTLLLLTKSKGTQTDPYEAETVRMANPGRVFDSPAPPSVTSSGTPQRPEDRSETSSLHPPVAGPLLTLVEHLSKLLGRLRAADISTLNRRLKKQHLPGDVSHLSRSTLRALHIEIADTKSLFRGLLDSTSIQRKEWNILFKLMKDVFTELVDMQAVINDITLEPKLAKRLQKEAFRDEEEEAALAAAAAASGGVGLGWIANPITRLFVTPAAEPPADAKVGGRAGDRGKLQAGGPPAKAASKQAAVSGATTTHVSVEFAGAGMTRRATPAPAAVVTSSTGVADGLPSPDPMSGALDRSRQVSANSVATLESTRAEAMGTTRTLRPPGTLRPSKSRANRNELLGIFAGAQATRPPLPAGQPWVVLGDAPGEGAKLRSASSQYFGPGAGSTIRARDGTTQRKRLSAVVDAVIDNAQGEDGEMPTHELPYQQQLFTRTMRPRGLSDSSIRSTYVSHAATSEMMPTAPPVDLGSSVARQGGYTGGLLAGLGRRLYWTKAEVSPINPIDAPPPPPLPTAHRSVSAGSRDPKESTSSLRSASTSSARPISVSASPDKRGAAVVGTHQGSNTDGGGFMSFIGGVVGGGAVLQGMNDSDEDAAAAGSLRRRDGMDKLERAELSGASFRQGVFMGGGSVR